MIIKYGIEVDKAAVAATLSKLINQTYKLLPNREENFDWKAPLDTIIEETGGMFSLLIHSQEKLFPLLCKLEGLYQLEDEDKFQSYRRAIFECLNLFAEIKKEVLTCQD